MTNKKTHSHLFILGLILLFTATLSSATAADTIYVNNATGNDSWDGTDATYQGGIVGPKATIQNGTDTVDNGGTVNVADGTYNEHVVVNKNMNLLGQSQIGTIINGTNNGIPLTINNGFNLILTYFTIQNGNANIGGGILNNGNLTINNCTIQQNIASSDNARGGGIFNGGNLTIDQSLIQQNTVNGLGTYGFGNGGGICNFGTLEVTNTIIQQNTVSGYGSQGGGISNLYANCNLENVTIQHNTVTGSYCYAGGVATISGTLNINNSTIQDNTVLGSQLSEGGALVADGILNISHSILQRNTVIGPYARGGAIYGYIATIDIDHCTILENTATGTINGDGGAIFTFTTPLTINHSIINNNTANSNGGAICISQSYPLTVNDTTFYGNSASGGGAIYNRGISNINQCNFLNNTAIAGGAMVNDHGTLNANFNRIYGNTATSVGNAVHVDGGTTDLEDNWWGLNQPVFFGLLSGVSAPTQWLYMTINATPNPINNGATSLITVSFNNYFDGTTITPFSPGNHLPDETPVLFQTDKGSIGSKSIDKITLMGLATATLTANETAGVARVNGTTDAQTVSTDVTINPKSSLYLTVTPSKTNPVTGETVTYTLKVGNNGPDAAENVVMTYTLPEGMEFVGASDDIGNQWTYDPATRIITWTLGTVPVGDPTLLLNLRFLRGGEFLINPLLSTTTYDPTLNEETQSLTVNAQQAPVVDPTTVGAEQVNTVAMQSTGTPLAGVILVILMVMGGLVSARLK